MYRSWENRRAFPVHDYTVALSTTLQRHKSARRVPNYARKPPRSPVAFSTGEFGRSSLRLFGSASDGSGRPYIRSEAICGRYGSDLLRDRNYTVSDPGGGVAKGEGRPLRRPEPRALLPVLDRRKAAHHQLRAFRSGRSEAGRLATLPKSSDRRSR